MLVWFQLLWTSTARKFSKLHTWKWIHVEKNFTMLKKTVKKLLRLPLRDGHE